MIKSCSNSNAVIDLPTTTPHTTATIPNPPTSRLHGSFPHGPLTTGSLYPDQPLPASCPWLNSYHFMGDWSSRHLIHQVTPNQHNTCADWFCRAPPTTPATPPSEELSSTTTTTPSDPFHHLRLVGKVGPRTPRLPPIPLPPSYAFPEDWSTKTTTDLPADPTSTSSASWKNWSTKTTTTPSDHTFHHSTLPGRLVNEDNQHPLRSPLPPATLSGKMVNQTTPPPPIPLPPATLPGMMSTKTPRLPPFPPTTWSDWEYTRAASTHNLV